MAFSNMIERLGGIIVEQYIDEEDIEEIELFAVESDDPTEDVTIPASLAPAPRMA